MNGAIAKVDAARDAALTNASDGQHVATKYVPHDIEEEQEEQEEEEDGDDTHNRRHHHARASETGDAQNVAHLAMLRGTSAGNVAELCQYIQTLETEKRDLLDQVHFLRDSDATRRLQLSAAHRRIDAMERRESEAHHASDAQQHMQLQIEAAVALERDNAAALSARLDAMQRQCEDAESARQHAVFKLSELQTTMAEAATNRLFSPPHHHHQLRAPTGERARETLDATSGSSERVEKLKREIELLRQKLELRDAQHHEKQKLAVELALRSAHLAHQAALDKLALECELRLSAWRHDEAVRAKEVEAAMEQDRYSIRLEMRHGMQRAQIDQRVYYLQAQAALALPTATTTTTAADAPTGGEVTFSAMDEVLVRMQLELLRTRRFAALKKLLLIRQAVVDRATRRALTKWKTVAVQTKLLRLTAVLHMHRLVQHFEKQNVRASFQRWASRTQQLRADAQRQQAAKCWNRMLAVERLVFMVQQRAVKHTARSFYRWRAHTAPTTASGGSCSSPSTTGFSTAAAAGDTSLALLSPAQNEPGANAAAKDVAVAVAVAVDVDVGAGGDELQDEIRKLHEQLASSKSEAWRYKRQLLKQFL